MSDHNTGHSGHSDDGDSNEPAQGVAYGAGHEMDVPPTKELFNIVWGLGALTLLSLVTCVQVFNNQARDIAAERGIAGSKVLADYRQGMDAATKTAGESSFKDSNGVEITQRYVPLTVARELMLSEPERLKAAAPPKGWMNPDDIAAGGGGGAAPAAQVLPDAGSAPDAGAVIPGEGPAKSDNSGTPEAPTGTLNPNQPGPIAPGRPGTDAPGPVHSEPGVPVADPKVTGAGSGTGATGAATDKPATPPATPTNGGKAAGDEGTSAPTQPAPTPAH